MKIHIPTEQYGFIEADVESVEQAESLSQEVKSMFSTGNGLSDKDFNQALDRYLTDGTGETEIYLAMNNEQKGIIQAYKRIGTLDDKD
jgi:hypothetical protein